MTTTTYEKSKYTGWTGRTELDLPEVPNRQDMGRYVKPLLCVSTSKRSNGAVTSFVGVQWEGGGFVTQAIFEDFARHYNSTRCARVTEQAIRVVHEKTLAQLDAIRAEATAQYLNRAEQVTA